jgi:uncharacterized membrane protein
VERFEHSVVVDEPVSAVYARWTQFGHFPKFAPGLNSVELLEGRRLKWAAHVGGRDISWETEIVENVPDRRVEWKSRSAPVHHGSIEFDAQGASRTVVTVAMEFEPLAPARATEDSGAARWLMESLAAEIGVFPPEEAAAKN